LSARFGGQTRGQPLSPAVMARLYLPSGGGGHRGQPLRRPAV